MTMKPLFTFILLLAVGFSSHFAPLQAQLLATSADSAAERARQETGGRVLSVQPSNDPARPGFIVKLLLQDGRVITKIVNRKN